jgi:hypothetical protein
LYDQYEKVLTSAGAAIAGCSMLVSDIITVSGYAGRVMLLPAPRLQVLYRDTKTLLAPFGYVRTYLGCKKAIKVGPPIFKEAVDTFYIEVMEGCAELVGQATLKFCMP